jgi:phage gpG-like protein
MSKGRDQVKLIFAKLKSGMDGAMNELPQIIGNEVKKYSREAFNNQEWNDKPWQKRKKETGRAILTGPGAVLKGSIRVIRTTYNSVITGTDLVYAQIHNEGGVIKRSAHSEAFVRPRLERGKNRGKFRRMTDKELSASPAQGFTIKEYEIKMPQRQFLGVTPELIKRIKREGNRHIKKFIKR